MTSIVRAIEEYEQAVRHLGQDAPVEPLASLLDGLSQFDRKA